VGGSENDDAPGGVAEGMGWWLVPAAIGGRWDFSAGWSL